MIRTIAGSLAVLSSVGLAVAAHAEPAPPLTEDKAGEVRSDCGYPQAAILDAGALSSVEELTARLPDRGTPQIVYGAQIAEADFREAAARLERTCFHSSRFPGSNWDGVSVSGLSFVRADLSGAMMRGARLDAPRFVGVNLSGANLAGASLRGGRWVGAYWESSLASTRFTGAQMESFVFECSIVMSESCGTEATIFTGASFRGADISQLSVYGGDDFTGAEFDRTVFDLRALAYLPASAQFTGPVYFYHASNTDPAQRQVEEFLPDDIAEIRRNLVDPRSQDVPSFDCEKAGTRAERLICGEWAQGLREADRLLAEVYTDARDKGLTTGAEQKRWLAERDRCEDSDCLEAAYAARTDALLGKLGPKGSLTPGLTRTYVEAALRFDPAFRTTPLYRRLAEPLRASALQGAALTMHEDGSISAWGEAIGGNAHMCNFGVERARFDPASGWYSAQEEDGVRVPLFRLLGDRLEFRYSGNMGDTPDEASRYLSCGARVGFGPMVALTP